jgi:hypothetical protein
MLQGYMYMPLLHAPHVAPTKPTPGGPQSEHMPRRWVSWQWTTPDVVLRVMFSLTHANACQRDFPVGVLTVRMYSDARMCWGVGELVEKTWRASEYLWLR